MHSGDLIRLDVAQRRLDLLVSEEQLKDGRSCFSRGSTLIGIHRAAILSCSWPVFCRPTKVATSTSW